MTDQRQDWIDELELADVRVKWSFSHFDGREEGYNSEGDHNFTVILDEEIAKKALAEGWAVKEMDPYEEGDPPEWLLKCKISYKYEPPLIYLIKNQRKLRAEVRDLRDIRRDTTERIDVILQPSRWVNGPNSGITAYVKELYATVRQSRFRDQYEDLEEI